MVTSACVDWEEAPRSAASNSNGMRKTLATRPGMKTRFAPGGSMVFAEGDPAAEAFVVLSGVVEISIRKQGRKVVLDRLGEGQMFGEMGIITDARRSATAYCLSDCELMVVDRSMIDDKMRNADPFVRFLVRSLIDIVRNASQRM